MLLLIMMQASQAPDLELRADVRVRSVTIEKQGDAWLTVSSNPDVGGNVVDIRAPRANGRKTLRNVEAKVRAEARIGDPARAVPGNDAPVETQPPQ